MASKALVAEAQAVLGLDVQSIIKAVLVSPMRSTGEIREADGVTSLEDLSASNTTVITRLVMQMSYNATKGDVKAAQFLFDYAGFKDNLAVDDDKIVFIDDIADPKSPIPTGEVKDAEFEILDEVDLETILDTDFDDDKKADETSLDIVDDL